MASKSSVVPVERIEGAIYLIHGEKMMLDEDLAELYGVETKALVLAVKRNIERFPDDFLFQLSADGFSNLRSQIVTSSSSGRHSPPCAFTEQSVAMLSGILRTGQAVCHYRDNSLYFPGSFTGCEIWGEQ
jgi:hypothetical protein